MKKMGLLAVSKIGKAVFVCITNKRGQTGISGVPVSDLDISRGYWPFRGRAVMKAQQCEVLVAVERSVIVGAWKIPLNAWQMGPTGAISTRQPEADDANRYWCSPIVELPGLTNKRIDAHGLRPMCGRSYLFNF